MPLTSATELAKERITVNAYAPGFIDTPMCKQRLQSFTGNMGRSMLITYVVSAAVSHMEGQPVTTDKDVIDSRLNAVRTARFRL